MNLDGIDTMYGTLYAPQWERDLIVRSLKDLGEWCATETILASMVFEQDEILWDAGAFLGTFALGVAKHKAPGHVVAIEANGVLTEALEKNLELLPCSSSLVSSGLGGKSGWLVPKETRSNNAGAGAYTYSETCKHDAGALRCESPAELRQRHGDYNFFKLDLEGMELDVLQADFNYIKSRLPVVWVECNEDRKSLKVFELLKSAAYDVCYLAFPAFRKASYTKPPSPRPLAYEAALVALPSPRLARFQEQVTEYVAGEDIIVHHLTSTQDLRRALFDTPRWSNLDRRQRWAWSDMTRAELIARLGRVTNGESAEQFLDDL